MGVALLILFLWCIASPLLAEIMICLFYGTGYLIRFLLICLWETAKLTAKIVAWIITRGAPAMFRAGLFIYLLADEALRATGAAEETPDGEANDPADDNLFESALTLLGLSDGCTRDELTGAYRRAMRRAHPDAGGSVDEAQAVNAARSIIMGRMGWA